MTKQLLALFIASVVLTGNAVAGVIPGRWEKVDSLNNGADIVVVMTSGERFVANFRSSDLESITVKPMGQEERRIAKAEIRQIEREGVKQDRALPGAALGAVVGAVIGALLGTSVEEGGSNRDAAIAAGLIGGAGAGFGVGYAVDSSFGKPILLYQATD